MQTNQTVKSLDLEISYEKYTSEDSTWIVLSQNLITDPARIQFKRSDRWESESIIVDGDRNAVELPLQHNTKNEFYIKCILANGIIVPCNPKSISIVQGIVDRFHCILPYTIATCYEEDGVKITLPIIGLQQGVGLPAIGVLNGIEISLFISKHCFSMLLYCKMEDAVSMKYVGSLLCTDDIINTHLNERVNITLKIDADAMLTADLYLPSEDKIFKMNLVPSESSLF